MQISAFFPTSNTSNMLALLMHWMSVFLWTRCNKAETPLFPQVKDDFFFPLVTIEYFCFDNGMPYFA